MLEHSQASDSLEDWLQSLDDEVGTPEFSTQGIELVVNIAQEQLKVERQIAQLEMVLKEMKKKLKDLQWQQLPDAMDEADLKKFELANGASIGIKEYLHCDMGKMDGDQKTRMYQWLIDHKHDQLIRTALEYDLDRGKFELATKIREMVGSEFGITAPLSHKVHWQSLDKWAREMRSGGEPFPEDLFNLNVGRRAVIK